MNNQNDYRYFKSALFRISQYCITSLQTIDLIENIFENHKYINNFDNIPYVICIVKYKDIILYNIPPAKEKE